MNYRGSEGERDLRVRKQILQEGQETTKKVFFFIVFFSYLKRLLPNFGEYFEITHCFKDCIDGDNYKIPFFPDDL